MITHAPRRRLVDHWDRCSRKKDQGCKICLQGLPRAEIPCTCHCITQWLLMFIWKVLMKTTWLDSPVQLLASAGAPAAPLLVVIGLSTFLWDDPFCSYDFASSFFCRVMEGERIRRAQVPSLLEFKREQKFTPDSDNRYYLCLVLGMISSFWSPPFSFESILNSCLKPVSEVVALGSCSPTVFEGLVQ